MPLPLAVEIIIAIAPLALELGKDIWDGLESVKNGKYPTFDSLIFLNDAVQKKIDAEKLITPA